MYFWPNNSDVGEEIDNDDWVSDKYFNFRPKNKKQNGGSSVGISSTCSHSTAEASDRTGEECCKRKIPDASCGFQPEQQHTRLTFATEVQKTRFPLNTCHRTHILDVEKELKIRE